MVVVDARVLMYAAACVIVRGIPLSACTSALASARLASPTGTLVCSSASASSSPIGSTWTTSPCPLTRLVAAMLFLDVIRTVPCAA
jgi:hypothetical protein